MRPFAVLLFAWLNLGTHGYFVAWSIYLGLYAIDLFRVYQFENNKIVDKKA